MEILQYPQVESLSTPSTSDTQSAEFSNDKKSFRCTFPNCGKIFKFKSEITRHNVIHFESRPFPCPHEGCGKTFKRADALDTHVRLHTRDMPFDCDFPGCDRSFTTKAALKYHLLKHNDERSFKCSFPGCDKAFFTKGQLKQHEKAYNYHISLSGVKVKEEPITSVKTFIKGQDPSYQEFYAPTPKIMQNIEWEIKNQTGEDDFVQKEEYQENFESIVKYILKDDKVVKDKLDLCTKIMDTFQDNDEPNFVTSNYQEWPEPIPEPSVFFDENEFKILDFLKEQAHNGY